MLYSDLAIQLPTITIFDPKSCFKLRSWVRLRPRERVMLGLPYMTPNTHIPQVTFENLQYMNELHLFQEVHQGLGFSEV
jgi:hypothetical protein